MRETERQWENTNENKSFIVSINYKRLNAVSIKKNQFILLNIWYRFLHDLLRLSAFKSLAPLFDCSAAPLLS